MTTTTGIVNRHPVFTYYALVFVISWGGFVAVGGSGLMAGTPWQTDDRFPLAVLLMLAGPPVAGVLTTIMVSGGPGLRGLLRRLVQWRVGFRWYAVALLTTPIVQGLTFALLSFFPTRIEPAIIASSDRFSLLVSGVAVGIIGGFVEELGWTGFVIPALRVRHGVARTGVVVGLLWGLWHLLQMLWVGFTSADQVPLSLFLPQYIFTAIAQLTAYRMLMVRVYARTGSLLVAILMHASLIFGTLFVLAPPITGEKFLIYSWVFAALLWVVVAATKSIDRGVQVRTEVG